MDKKYPVVLTIAGSDPSGGAGIQADIKTCTALGVYSCAVITAMTAQNTCGVSGVFPTPTDFLRLELTSVLDDIRPDAVKIGMLPDRESALAVTEILESRGLDNIVTDPLLVSTSGHRLSDTESATDQFRELFGISAVVTPNIPEAEALIGHRIESDEEMADAAEAIVNEFKCKAAVLKGGHSSGNILTDHIAIRDSDGRIRRSIFRHKKVPTINTHGTGCTLSSAIAAHLAAGYDLDKAIFRAILWLTEAIKAGAGYRTGRGYGPVNHLFPIKPII